MMPSTAYGPDYEQRYLASTFATSRGASPPPSVVTSSKIDPYSSHAPLPSSYQSRVPLEYPSVPLSHISHPAPSAATPRHASSPPSSRPTSYQVPRSEMHQPHPSSPPVASHSSHNLSPAKPMIGSSPPTTRSSRYEPAYERSHMTADTVRPYASAHVSTIAGDRTASSPERPHRKSPQTSTVSDRYYGGRQPHQSPPRYPSTTRQRRESRSISPPTPNEGMTAAATIQSIQGSMSDGIPAPRRALTYRSALEEERRELAAARQIAAAVPAGSSVVETVGREGIMQVARPGRAEPKLDLTSWKARISHLIKEDLRHLITSQYDRNCSGSIDFCDFLALWFSGQTFQIRRSRCGEVDTDGNKVVETLEVQARHIYRIREVFNEYEDSYLSGVRYGLVSAMLKDFQYDQDHEVQHYYGLSTEDMVSLVDELALHRSRSPPGLEPRYDFAYILQLLLKYLTDTEEVALFYDEGCKVFQALRTKEYGEQPIYQNSTISTKLLISVLGNSAYRRDVIDHSSLSGLDD